METLKQDQYVSLSMEDQVLELFAVKHRFFKLIPVEKIGDYFTKFIKYYETGDSTQLKRWLYETSIDGLD